MNIKLIKFLAALCALLFVIIIGEWWYASHAQNQLIASIEKIDKQQKHVAELPTLELTKQPESSFVNLVNRPLFIQGRRPVQEAATETKATTSQATESFNWSLNGIYTYKKALYALMSRTTGKVPKDNYRKVTINGEIDGWIFTEIHKDKVVVSQGEKTKELPLRKPKPKGNTNNPAQPPTMQQMPPVPNDPSQQLAPGQVPPPQMPMDGMPNGMPGTPGMGMPGAPGTMPEQIPEVMPEPIPEAIPEPEIIPEEPSDIYLENNENVQYQ